jgi:hypothetical protein
MIVLAELCLLFSNLLTQCIILLFDALKFNREFVDILKNEPILFLTLKEDFGDFL